MKKYIFKILFTILDLFWMSLKLNILSVFLEKKSQTKFSRYFHIKQVNCILYKMLFYYFYNYLNTAKNF